MRRLVNSDFFIILWGVTSLLCWPAGVVMAIIGLVAGEKNGEIYI